MREGGTPNYQSIPISTLAIWTNHKYGSTSQGASPNKCFQNNIRHCDVRLELPLYPLITSHVGKKRRGHLARVHPWTQFPTSPIVPSSMYIFHWSQDNAQHTPTCSYMLQVCPNQCVLTVHRILFLQYCIFDFRHANNFLRAYYSHKQNVTWITPPPWTSHAWTLLWQK